MGMTLLIPIEIIKDYMPFILNALVLVFVMIGFRKEVFKK